MHVSLILSCWLAAAPVFQDAKTEKPSWGDGSATKLTVAEQRRAAHEAAFEKELLQRRDRLAPEDLEGLVELARWCESQGEEKAALSVYREVVKAAPDHVLASAAVESLEESLRLREERRLASAARKIERVERAEQREERRRLRLLEVRINALIREIAYGSKSRSDRALRDVIEIARELKNRDVAAKAVQVQRRFDAYWRELRVQQTGLAEVRATMVKLKRPIKTFSTSLGTGSPVTLQLPERQIVSVQTTVAIPMGRGQ